MVQIVTLDGTNRLDLTNESGKIHVYRPRPRPFGGRVVWPGWPGGGNAGPASHTAMTTNTLAETYRREQAGAHVAVLGPARATGNEAATLGRVVYSASVDPECCLSARNGGPRGNCTNRCAVAPDL